MYVCLALSRFRLCLIATHIRAKNVVRQVWLHSSDCAKRGDHQPTRVAYASEEFECVCMCVSVTNWQHSCAYRRQCNNRQAIAEHVCVCACLCDALYSIIYTIFKCCFFVSDSAHQTPKLHIRSHSYVCVFAYHRRVSHQRSSRVCARVREFRVISLCESSSIVGRARFSARTSAKFRRNKKHQHTH